MSRLLGLDALRGVAALCVAYSHLIAKMKRDGHFDGLTSDLFLVSKTVLDVGKTSVLVLFALSGYFVVAALYKAAIDTNGRSRRSSISASSGCFPCTGYRCFSA